MPGDAGGASTTQGTLPAHALSLEGEGPASAILNGSFDDCGFFDSAEGDPCPPLTGTVTTTTFATACESNGCTPSLIGGMTAQATLKDGTFSVDLDLEHQDARRNIACPATSSSWTDGTPGS